MRVLILLFLSFPLLCKSQDFTFPAVTNHLYLQLNRQSIPLEKQKISIDLAAYGKKYTIPAPHSPVQTKPVKIVRFLITLENRNIRDTCYIRLLKLSSDNHQRVLQYEKPVPTELYDYAALTWKERNLIFQFWQLQPGEYAIWLSAEPDSLQLFRITQP